MTPRLGSSLARQAHGVPVRVRDRVADGLACLLAVALVLTPMAVRPSWFVRRPVERPDAVLRLDDSTGAWTSVPLPGVSPRPRSTPCRDVPPPGTELRFASTAGALARAIGAHPGLRFARVVGRARGAALVREPDGRLALYPCTRFHDVWQLA